MSRLPPAPNEEAMAISKAAPEAGAAAGAPHDLAPMMWKPAMFEAFANLQAVVMARDGAIDPTLKLMIGFVVSRSAGSRYCQSIAANALMRLEVGEAKISALLQFEDSLLFSAAQRAALAVAELAPLNPNSVDASDFAALKRHFANDAICEILGVISLFAFLNRWHDTLATPVEERAIPFLPASLGHSEATSVDGP